MPASHNLAKSIRNQQAVFNLMKKGNYLYASKENDLKNKKWLKNQFFSQLNQWTNAQVTEKMKELHKRQTAVNLSRLLGSIKPNTTIPNNYVTPILLLNNPKHIMWRVTDPGEKKRVNWFTPKEVRGMVNMRYPIRGNWLNAANKNSYGIFMAGPNKNLFIHPLTRSRIKRKNVELVRPRPKANTGSSSQRRNN
jgi:hypothetical protein